MDTSKLTTAGLYSTPAAGATLAAYLAYRLGVPVEVVLAGAALLGQGLHVLANYVQSKRTAPSSPPATPAS